MDTNKPEARVAVIGTGNSLAGDDGAGVAVIDRLESTLRDDNRVQLARLDSDIFSLDEYLDRAEILIIVDSVIDETPGKVVFVDDCQDSFPASLHQTDITTVLHWFKDLEVVTPFPEWQVWGITISPPSLLGEGLSPKVEEAVEELSSLLRIEVKRLLEES